MEFKQSDTGGLMTVHDSSGAVNGVAQVLKNSIARTDTAAKTLGYLPANAIISAITVKNPVASNAATTATISVGKSGGTGTEYVNAQDVKGAALGQVVPTTVATLDTIGTANVTVTGIYAETGAASTTGGPWTVFIHYYVP